jgi:hypothetical protein
MSNRYLRQDLIPDAGVETTIYTVPAATTGIARSLRVTNANANATNVTVTQYSADAPATTIYLLKNKVLAANASVDVFNGVPCVVESGDVLKVTSSAASGHFYLSYLEVDRN